MHSHKELLDMVATDALDPELRDHQGNNLPNYEIPREPQENSPSVNYDLRLVKHPDGRMEWKD